MQHGADVLIRLKYPERRRSGCSRRSTKRQQSQHAATRNSEAEISRHIRGPSPDLPAERRYITNRIPGLGTLSCEPTDWACPRPEANRIEIRSPRPIPVPETLLHCEETGRVCAQAAIDVQCCGSTK